MSARAHPGRRNLLVLAVLLWAPVASAGEPAPLSPEAHALLRDAVVAATEGREDVRARNLDALEKVAGVRWPQVAGLPWFHVTLSDGRTVSAWRIGDEESTTFMATDFRAVTLERKDIERIEPVGFREDVKELIRLCREANEEDKSSWDFAVVDRGGFPFHRGVFLLRWAVAAAEHGYADETRTLVAEVLKRVPSGLPNAYDEMVWSVLRPAMFAFRDEGDRARFLKTLKGLLADFPGSRYDAQLKSLIEPMEREGAAPEFLEHPRTEEEHIRCWIYRLRDLAGRQFSDPGSPQLFSIGGAHPTAANQLVEIGPAAIPFLIEALEDYTPTRTIAWQRSYYPEHFVLRRQDIAMKCLERITGCRFYEEAATFRHLYMDDSARRASAISNVKEWWARSRGTSQAQGVRNQLALHDRNESLGSFELLQDLGVLAMLDGPEAVIDQAKLMAGDEYLLSCPLNVLDMIDPRLRVQAAFRRFRDNASEDGDYTYIYRYGDQETYAEIVRRLEAGKLDPGPGDATYAAKYGRNWAIPIVGRILARTEMTGSRYVNTGEWVSFSEADEAAEVFQELTGRHFGYAPEKDEADRLAAIRKMRDWWDGEGRKVLAGRIAEDHAPVVSAADLLQTDAELAATVAAIESPDEAVRRAAVAGLGDVMSFQVQRALLHALGRERRAAERSRILRALEAHPVLWHVPTLAAILEKDEDTATRVLAGKIIERIVGDKSSFTSWNRLESREVGLDVARRLAADSAVPAEVRDVSRGILSAWGSPGARTFLASLDATRK